MLIRNFIWSAYLRQSGANIRNLYGFIVGINRLSERLGITIWRVEKQRLILEIFPEFLGVWFLQWCENRRRESII